MYHLEQLLNVKCVLDGMCTDVRHGNKQVFMYMINSFDDHMTPLGSEMMVATF